MKSLFFALVVSLSFSFTSNAQTDTTYVKVLIEMLEVSGAEASFNAAMDQIFTLSKSQYTNLSDEMWSELETEIRKISFKELMEMFTPVYQKHLSIDDLQASIEFYKTPAGKRIAEKTPIVNTETMVIAQKWGMELSQKVFKKIEEMGH